jgi:hypothetical protein
MSDTMESLRAQLRAAEGERDEARAELTRNKDREDALLSDSYACEREQRIRAAAAEEAKERAEREAKSLGEQWVRESARLVRKADAAEDRATAAEGALREAREEIVWAHACLRRVATKEHQDHVEIGTRSFGLLVGQQRIARIAAALREPQLGKPGAVAPRMVRACGACGGSGAIYETHDVGVTERIGCEECNATGFLPAPPPETP